MWDAGNNRSLQPVTVAILDFMVSHPYATKELIRQKLGFERQQVQSTYYHYGFTGSDAAKKKYPDLWAIGEQIRKKWPAKPAQASLPLKAAKTAKPAKWKAKTSPAVWPDADPVNQVSRIYSALEKKAEPTAGQAVLREVVKADDAEITKLRKEVTQLRTIVAYLEKRLGITNGNAV
jgi:hypothetical protein